ncbi:hypothetical protein BDD12DRAFT_879970 [Trichophaea hybrida]|nr:hypothetical protein BDD12DRAFT_879970 [Trichophaea hybrida]
MPLTCTHSHPDSLRLNTPSHSSLASISFENASGTHIWIYYQETDGAIKETLYDSATGWRLHVLDVIDKAKPNTGTAATT